MKNLINKYKEWKNQRALKSILKNRYVLDIIRRDVRTLAEKMVMEYLDSKRVNHCKKCPSTNSLRKASFGYCCDSHLEEPLQVVK